MLYKAKAYSAYAYDLELLRNYRHGKTATDVFLRFWVGAGGSAPPHPKRVGGWHISTCVTAATWRDKVARCINTRVPTGCGVARPLILTRGVSQSRVASHVCRQRSYSACGHV